MNIEPLNRSIYIDGNNLYRGAKELGFEIDYKKFYGWLRQKFNTSEDYIFIGFLENKKYLYQYLKNCGFILVFKETFLVNEKVKGNCDSELVLKVVKDFYTREFDKCILITGDGDFGCVIEFLEQRSVLSCVIVPDINKCSFLIKNKNLETVSLNEHYHKFSTQLNEKAPDADVSA